MRAFSLMKAWLHGRRPTMLVATLFVALAGSVALRLAPTLGSYGSARAEAAEKESWLKRHEAQGGHTLARHVGKDEAWLRGRLADDPRLSRASSFPDIATAEKVIMAAGNANRNTIGEWLRNDRVGSRITLDYEGRQKIGISVSRRSPQVFDCFKARIVLQSVKGPDYFILTAYPD